MKFEIPLILEIEASNIQEAREIVYRSLLQTVASNNNQKVFAFPKGTTAIMADDTNTIKEGHRIVILHPEKQSIDQYLKGGV